MGPRASRRELVRASLAALGVGALLAEGPPPALAKTAAGLDDHGLLLRVLRIETLLVYCYERAVASGSLGPGAATLVGRLLEHERQHVGALQGELSRRGGGMTFSWNLRTAARELARHHVGARLTPLRSQRDCVRLLVDVESVAEGAWFAALAHLADPALASLGASVMACEAQHWTALSDLSHHRDFKKTVPYAFVRGSSGY